MNKQDDVEQYLNLIADKIKLERKKRNISQLKLATILNHGSPNYIAKIENRAKGANYNLKHLYIISIAFSMSVQDLLPPYQDIDMDKENGDS